MPRLMLLLPLQWICLNFLLHWLLIIAAVGFVTNLSKSRVIRRSNICYMVSNGVCNDVYKFKLQVHLIRNPPPPTSLSSFSLVL